MPGFMVKTQSSTVGGGVGSQSPNADTEYYYSYTWEIFHLFEDINPSRLDPTLIHARDISLPTFTANMDSLVGASLEYKWAKSVVWEDIKITWYDVRGLIDIMSKWRKRIWSQDKGLQVASEYKKLSAINVYDSTWDSGNMIEWKLINSWPKMIKHGELTYTQSDVKLVEVTVTYDWAEENEKEYHNLLKPRRDFYRPRPVPASAVEMGEDVEAVGDTITVDDHRVDSDRSGLGGSARSRQFGPYGY